jgi:D-arginine dehydrogenase
VTGQRPIRYRHAVSTALTCDIAIVGAGIAGASLAWHLVHCTLPAPPRRVLLLERESHPGMHATGRSAAMFMESYGPPQVRALTRASRAFYTRPHAGFTEVRLMSPRGAMYVAAPEQRALLDEMWASMRAEGLEVQRLDAAETLARVAVLRPGRVLGAIVETDAQDLDVHAIHQGFLRGFRSRGGEVRCNAELVEGHFDIAVEGAGRWTLRLADSQTLHAATLVNAAGAWVDEVAQRCGVAALGFEPRRRSAFTFDPPEGIEVSTWPVVAGIDESWYFKPDAGRLLGSPANADPTHPHDVQPEELDIATGIHLIEQATTMTIRRPASTWAGLRTFSRSGELVIGRDAACPAFFWLAGQGGYGIQSAPGAGLLAAALLGSGDLPEVLASHGVDARALSPAQLATRKDAFEAEFADCIAAQNESVASNGIPGSDIRPW